MQKYEIYLKETETFEYHGNIDSRKKVTDFCYDYLNLHMSDRERCYIIAVNVKGVPIGVHELAIGGSTSAIIEIPIIFRFLINCNAYAFFMVHNHPSGDPTPSKDDEKTTERVWEASKILGIKFVDHIIISASKKWYSFVEEENIL